MIPSRHVRPRNILLLAVLMGGAGIHAMKNSPTAIEAAYRLDATGPGRWADADLILLENSKPVELAAELKSVADLPSGAREGARLIHWTASAGQIKSDPTAPGKATWTPPAGSETADVVAEAEIKLEGLKEGAATVRKRVAFRFLTPLSSSHMSHGVIDGYEVGEYPTMGKPHSSQGQWVAKHADRYAVPSHFYKVANKEAKALKISPHITLGHFVIDYPWGSLGLPQYVAVDLNLVEKLEDLIDLMQKDGKFKVNGLTPIYGFRSPKFNRQTIEHSPDKNLKVMFSMHQYGRAMDFIIDEDNDLVMDDLNGDGKHDIYDAAQIMHYVNILDRKYRDEKRMEMVGGAGIYQFHDFAGRVASPYIHVDTRGFVGESGNLIRWKEPQPEGLWPDGTPIHWSKI